MGHFISPAVISSFAMAKIPIVSIMTVALRGRLFLFMLKTWREDKSTRLSLRLAHKGVTLYSMQAINGGLAKEWSRVSDLAGRAIAMHCNRAERLQTASTAIQGCIVSYCILQTLTEY
jgi:hypothetical protein